MALENKIQHFKDVSIKQAEAQRDAVLEEYEKGLLQLLEVHKKEAVENAALREKMEFEDLKRQSNKALLKESLEIKRTFSLRQKEMVEKIFIEVNELIEAFRKTEDYQLLLLKQIESAYKTAGNEEVVIYIDLDDEKIIDTLRQKSGKELTLSKYTFGGGTRAVIPSKNILIENSFNSKVAEEKEKFRLTF